MVRAEMRLYTVDFCYQSNSYSLQLWLHLISSPLSLPTLFYFHWLVATPVAPLRLSSNYLACWSTELGQWGWPYAALAPSSNTPSQQAWSLCSLEVSRGVLIMQIYVSYLLVMPLIVVLRNIISQVLVPWVPFHNELFVIDLVDGIKVILLHQS